jgi:hypothetical protein
MLKAYKKIKHKKNSRQACTCHHAFPGIVNWKKFRALQTIERVFPGAIGMLNEQIHMTHFWSPKMGNFVSTSILHKPVNKVQNHTITELLTNK